MKELIKKILLEYTRWNRETVSDLAKNFETKMEFRNAYPAAYKWATVNGILDDITKHMRVVRQKWTKEMVQDEALKYQTRGEFARNSSKAYDMAQKYGWLEDVTKHMKKVLTYWTEEMTQEEALKYTTRKDFAEGSPRAYDAARAHGWLNDITTHMVYIGNMYKRMVYAFEFPDNSVYVGLTLNQKQREKQHTKLDEKSNSAVSKKIRESQLLPIMVQISDGYLPSDDAQKLEECKIEEYREKGWTILNVKKAGALGFCERKWTYETVIDEAKKYNSRTEWARNSSASYHLALMNGWVEEMTKHMKPVNYTRWNSDTVRSIAQKYDKKWDFQKYDGAAYQWAARNKILDDITSHMKTRKIWTDDEIINLANQYPNRAKFQKAHQTAYKYAVLRGLLDQIFPYKRKNS